MLDRIIPSGLVLDCKLNRERGKKGLTEEENEIIAQRTQVKLDKTPVLPLEADNKFSLHLHSSFRSHA